MKRLIAIPHSLTRLAVLSTRGAPFRGIAVIFVIVWLLTLKFDSSNLYTVNVCLLAGIGATGLNLAMGTAGLVSVGTAAFLATGGFVTVIARHSGVPFPLDIGVGTLAAGALGAILCFPGLRLRGLYLALSTVAVHFIVLFAANEYQVHKFADGGFVSNTLFSSSSLKDAQIRTAWLLSLILAVVLLLAYAIMHGRLGRALRLIRDHELVAPSYGIPVTGLKALTWFVSSALIGLEGGLSWYIVGTVSTDNYTLTVAVQYIAMVLLGGVDTVFGGVIGAAVVMSLPTIIPQVMNGLSVSTSNGNLTAAISTLIYGALVVIVVRRFPLGIAGRFAIARRLVLGRTSDKGLASGGAGLTGANGQSDQSQAGGAIQKVTSQSG